MIILIVPIAAAAVAGGVAAVDLTKAYKEEREKRKQIRIERDKNIASIRTAKLVVTEKLNGGAYQSLDEAMADFEFQKIVAYNTL